jgi:putative tryptophan/tyrosine transport system substrate-binding protein
VRRRDAIVGMGATVLWPLAARAQKKEVTVGLLSSLAQKPMAKQVENIYRGLKDAGFVPGQNLRVEERWADVQYDRLPALARELVALKVDVIATIGGNVSATAAKAATATIPIVFATADDPVATGLVTNFTRPSANLTGVTWMGADLLAKDMEALHELLPAVSEFGVLVNPERPTAAAQLRSAKSAADSIGRKIRALNVTSPSDIDALFDGFAREPIGAIIVSADALFNVHRERLVALAAREKIPTVYFLPEFVAAGGLMSYGSSLKESFYQVGVYSGRVLNGARPADLPIQQSTKVELVINLKTAKALGLTIPITLLGRADEVIE